MKLELIGQAFIADFSKRMRAIRFWTAQPFLKVVTIKDVIFVYRAEAVS